MELFLADKQLNSIAVVSGFQVTRYQVPESEGVSAPASIKLNAETASRFMDALWEASVRPSSE